MTLWVLFCPKMEAFSKCEEDIKRHRLKGAKKKDEKCLYDNDTIDARKERLFEKGFCGKSIKKSKNDIKKFILRFGNLMVFQVEKIFVINGFLGRNIDCFEF